MHSCNPYLNVAPVLEIDDGTLRDRRQCLLPWRRPDPRGMVGDARAADAELSQPLHAIGQTVRMT